MKPFIDLVRVQIYAAKSTIGVIWQSSTEESGRMYEAMEGLAFLIWVRGLFNKRKESCIKLIR